MKTRILMVAGLSLSLFGTGCVATHKYVAKTIAPVEQRVSTAEAKNGEQDQKLAANASQIESVDRDLSRTKERLTDTDAKATAAGTAAATADAKAVAADAKAVAANNAAGAADGRAQNAQKGADAAAKSVDTLRDDVRNGKYKMVKSDNVLFALNGKTLTDEAKAQLDSFAGSLSSMSNYVVEVQGFTDKTGAATYNEELSQDRATTVARYLANQHKVPLRSINLLGSGIAQGEQKTRDERAQSRRVEVRIFVPEI